VAQIDYSQPLVLGFAFYHAADKINELISTYIKVGIREEDIRMPEGWLVDEWSKNGYPLSVYATGSEAQLAEVSKQGYEFAMGHVLGPWK
jgi:hypothetical protein